jgi:hypothetical protein
VRNLKRKPGNVSRVTVVNAKLEMSQTVAQDRRRFLSFSGERSKETFVLLLKTNLRGVEQESPGDSEQLVALK